MTDKTTYLISLITAIISFFIPIIDFIFSKASNKNKKGQIQTSEIMADIHFQNNFNNGNGNTNVLGDRNTIISGNGNTITKIFNSYPQPKNRTIKSKSIFSDDFVCFLFCMFIMISFASFKTYIITAEAILNFIAIFLTLLSAKYISTSNRVLLYAATILSTLVLFLIIYNNVFAPAGFTLYLHNIGFNELPHSGCKYIFSNLNFFIYLAVELLSTAFFISITVIIVKTLSRPIIYNLTIRHLKFIAIKIKLQSKEDFDNTIKRYIIKAFVGSVIIFISSAKVFQLFAWISSLMNKSSSYIKSIEQ